MVPKSGRGFGWYNLQILPRRSRNFPVGPEPPKGDLDLRAVSLRVQSTNRRVFRASLLGIVITQRLQCSSFLLMTFFLLRDCNKLPRKELPSSLWVLFWVDTLDSLQLGTWTLKAWVVAEAASQLHAA